MDRALWLLLWFRFLSWVRRARRSIGTAKGSLLALLGLMIFIPWALSVWFSAPEPEADHLETVRRLGPLVLLTYCLATLLLSTGERGISFNSAEVDFLFPAPAGALWMVECKAAKTVLPPMAGPMMSLRRPIGNRSSVRMAVVHRPSQGAPQTRVLAPGVEALTLPDFVEELNDTR